MHRRTEPDNRLPHDHLPENNPYDHSMQPGAPAALGDLVAHFGYLADTPGFEPLVERVFARAHDHRWQGARLFVDFGAGVVLVAGPPQRRRLRGWPASFVCLMRRHSYLAFPDEDGFGLLLGEGDIEPELLEGHELSAYDDLRVPLTDGANWWLYHPEVENVPGEPVLCLYSFEHGIEETVAMGPGTLFLRRMAECLGLDWKQPSTTKGRAGH